MWILCSEILTFKYVYIVSLETNQRWLFVFVHQKSWKFASKTDFSAHNIHLYLCWQVDENITGILCCRKMVLNVQYLRFLMYKYLIVYNIEIFNKNISHQLFHYKVRKHKFKREFYTQKPVLNFRFKDFW